MSEVERLVRTVDALIGVVDRLTQQNQAIVQQNNQLILLMAGETVEVETGAEVPRGYLNGRDN